MKEEDRNTFNDFSKQVPIYETKQYKKMWENPHAHTLNHFTRIVNMLFILIQFDIFATITTQKQQKQKQKQNQ